MARFNGAKQGLAVWLWGVLMALVIAAVAAIAGAQYDVFAQLNLPRLPVNEGQVTAVGAIAIGAAILAALIGAVLGGLAGMRFHRKVDKAGLEPRERPHHLTEPSIPPTHRFHRAASPKETAMNIDKDTILNLLRSNGQDADADQAQQDLPDQVDTDQDAGLLERFGINPADLIAKFTGGRPRAASAAPWANCCSGTSPCVRRRQTGFAGSGQPGRAGGQRLRGRAPGGRRERPRVTRWTAAPSCSPRSP